MIFTESIIPIVDNSGARRARVLKSLGRSRKYARVGEVVIVSMKEVVPRRKIKKGTIHKVLIVSSPEWRKRGGNTCWIQNNFWAGIVLRRDGMTPRATRIKIPVSLELFTHYQVRTLCLANKII